MKRYTAIIIDDEKHARETLASYLGKYCSKIEVLGEAENIIVAESLINLHNPDILFLDIEMPFGNAFDLLENVNLDSCEIIFITAFSQYAIQALNMSAAHYLLKPIDIDELIHAVDKAIELKSKKHQINRAGILVENLQQKNNHLSKKIVLPSLHGFEVKQVADILYCQADENYTKFYFKDNSSSLICKKLKHYESLLEHQGFQRIHRSTLINLEYVKKYIKGRGGQVELHNGKVLDVSESKKKSFLDRFRT